MEYLPLGNSGLKVSRLGLGCGNFGGVGSAPEFFGKGESKREAFMLMDIALDLGINFFDTANSYGGGRSESYIGEWLKAKGSAVRDQILISSKVYNSVGPGPNDWGLSRRHILSQVEASLGRLGVEALDMYLIHEPDPSTPLEETLHTLDDLVRQGKLRYLGASNMPAWLLTKSLWLSDKLRLERFAWVQNAYSLLEPDDERELFPLLADQELGYTPFSPLAGGLLTGKYGLSEAYPDGSRMTTRPDSYLKHWTRQTFEAIEALQKKADAHKVSLAGLALAWVMSHPQVTAPIIGPRKPDHFKPAREALSVRLSDSDRAEISQLFEVPLNPLGGE